MHPTKPAPNRPTITSVRDLAGLPGAHETEIIDLTDADDSTFELVAAPVRKQLGEPEVRMLAYNGSVPGPTLRVRQGSTVTIAFRNEPTSRTPSTGTGCAWRTSSTARINAGASTGRGDVRLSGDLPGSRRLLVPPPYP